MSHVTREQFVSFCNQFNEPMVNRFLRVSEFSNPSHSLDRVGRQEIIDIATKMHANLNEIAPEFATSNEAFVTREELVGLFSKTFRVFNISPKKNHAEYVGNKLTINYVPSLTKDALTEDRNIPSKEESTRSVAREEDTVSVGNPRSKADKEGDPEDTSEVSPGGFLTQKAHEEVEDSDSDNWRAAMYLQKLTSNEPDHHRVPESETRYDHSKSEGSSEIVLTPIDTSSSEDNRE